MWVVPLLRCCVCAWVAPTAPVDTQAALHKRSFTGVLEEGCAPAIRFGFNFLLSFTAHYTEQKATLLYLLGVGEEGEGILLGENCCHCFN